MVICFLDFWHLLTGPREPIAHYPLCHSVVTPPSWVRSGTTERRVSRVLTVHSVHTAVNDNKFSRFLGTCNVNCVVICSCHNRFYFRFFEKKKCNLIQQGLCFSSFQTLHVPRAHSWFFTHCYALYNVSTKTVLSTERTLWRGNFYTFKSYYFYIHRK